MQKSFPLNSSCWLRCQIIENAVDAFYLGGNAGYYFVKDCVGDLLYGCGHCVLGVYRADYRGPALIAAVILNADALDIGDNHEILPYPLGKSALIKLVAKDRVCLAKCVKPVPRDSTEATNAKTGAREGLTVYHCVGKTESFAYNSYLILEKKLKRLNERELKVLGKSAYVVVRLDCLLALTLLYALEDVGVDGSLRIV